MNRGRVSHTVGYKLLLGHRRLFFGGFAEVAINDAAELEAGWGRAADTQKKIGALSDSLSGDSLSDIVPEVFGFLPQKGLHSSLNHLLRAGS